MAKFCVALAVAIVAMLGAPGISQAAHGHGGFIFVQGYYPYYGYPYYGRHYAYPYYPPSYPSAYPTYVVPAPAPVAPPPAAAAAVWYYCPPTQSYYPYVSTCAVAWQQVPATPR
jgi:hypothetical protein